MSNMWSEEYLNIQKEILDKMIELNRVKTEYPNGWFGIVPPRPQWDDNMKWKPEKYTSDTLPLTKGETMGAPSQYSLIATCYYFMSEINKAKFIISENGGGFDNEDFNNKVDQLTEAMTKVIEGWK